MIKTIAHVADIHIRKTPTRNEEYQKVFDNLIKSLQQKKPDRIVIVGDLVNDYLDLQGEQLIMANKLLNELAKIAPVRITRGNHDCRKKNLKRVDSVKAIVETLNNPNVIYYDKTDVFYDENVAWFVWHHGEKKNNPWKTKEGKIYETLRSTAMTKDENGQFTVPEYVAIDLFHDPVNGCVSDTGFEMKSKQYYKLTDFKGDYSFFGDIHHKQFLDRYQTKAYCGSLIAQKFTEGDDEFHGYLLWHIETTNIDQIPIENDYSYNNIRLSPYFDFDDIDFEIENPTKHMRLRFIWGTLPSIRNKENERKLIEYVNTQYKGKILSIAHKNEFIENENIEVNENINLENINNSAVQHEIFKEYLDKIGVEEKVIDDVIALDKEISANVDVSEVHNIQWDIVKFGGTNFASYEQLDIDWRDMEGLFQISGINTAGKSTIMKLISYILYNKSLETDYRQKFGDTRFVNNRNGATFCDTYMVLEANGEYFGIKRKTEIETKKDGEIKGAPTTLNYYLLASPDEEMSEDNLLENLEEDRRIQTQKKMTAIIGDYENFKRIVLTTSDTLNEVLSSDMSVFVDSLLYDSGLDIFDKKLEGFKMYQKGVNEKGRIVADIDVLKNENGELLQENAALQTEIVNIETTNLPEVQDKIKKGREYVETLTKKLFKIDPEIVDLDIEDTQSGIKTHENEIVALNGRKTVLEQSINSLQENYNEERLNELITKRDNHKTEEYNLNLKIKGYQQNIRDTEHDVEIIRGKIMMAKNDGKKLKDEILELKNSTVCPTCGQNLTEEHLEHLNEKIKKLETEMFPIAGKINNFEKEIKEVHNVKLDKIKKEIDFVSHEINHRSLQMEGILKEIGNLTNQKNDVEKRKEFQTELNQIPTKIENEELKKAALQKKIDDHKNSKLQIAENVKIQGGIDKAKTRLEQLEIEEDEYKEDVLIKKGQIGENSSRIVNNETTIIAFEEQEHRDIVMDLYKKCVHRDGIPKQMLANYILPMINQTLNKILTIAPFRIWLSVDDFRPKLMYNSRPNAIIDCIGASGKERTFASVVLKFALNQINIKAKPRIFLLDEVMGKLSEESVEEFIEILHIMKNNAKKVLIVEHDKEVNPDYLINVTVDENGISSLVIE